MEKKPKSREAKTPKSQPFQKIIGNSKLQINEDDASRLIGSIVEKGASDDPRDKPFAPTPAPKPTVLPFPVARHRSHGPHWGPPVAKRVEDDGDGSDDHEEDEEARRMLAAADRIAALAGPVQRKEKKGLDLSHWRELVQSKDSSNAKRIKESSRAEAREQPHNREDTNAAEKIIAQQDSTPFLPANDTSKSRNSNLGAEVGKSAVNMELDNWDRGTSLKTDTCFGRDSEPMIIDKQSATDRMAVDDAGNGLSSVSLESQIDAENRARLQGMSPDEIAEAQAEILDKMDPILLETLKRRGLEKLKKKKNLNGAGLAPSDQLSGPPVDTRSNIEVSPHSESADSLVVTSRSTKSNLGAQGVTAVESKGNTGSSLWNAWSEKVEGVRNLRFSLDGNVVNSDANPVSGTHSASVQKEQYADNVTERDFLRAEGDPGAAGYTIKEAVALSRSVIPGQRSLALHLLASVLDKAIHNVAEDQIGVDLAKDIKCNDQAVDWRAVWAFALGPEPELVLSLRMSLDDNHTSVVLACAKAIQCILSCDLNEQFFDNLENTDQGMDVYTAPVFRSKPEIDVGFLQGGFWKYSAKSSNLLPYGETSDEDAEGKHTIQDDIVVAGQDFTAGLIRMGILPRICYLLEMDPMSVLEERLISILIAIARHSPRGANAIMECPRLVPAIINRFNETSNNEINQSKIKSVTLLKILAKSDRIICLEFINNGTFTAVTRHLYQSAVTLDQWVISGEESCRLSAALMVEQLRLWKVCIRYGFCLSNFSDVFPSICLFLYPPPIEKLLKKQIFREFASVSKEAYLVLGALATRLPAFHLEMHEKDQRLQGNGGGDNSGTWSWAYVGPLVDIGLMWLTLKSEAQVSQLFEDGDRSKDGLTLQDKSVSGSLLWVYSAVMQMLSAVLEKLDPNKTSDGGARLAWLPNFVPRIGLELIKNGFFCSLSSADSVNNGADQTQSCSFIEGLCYSRLKSNSGTSLASVCCLHGLIKVVELLDRLIHLAKAAMRSAPIERLDLSREGKILEKGILKWCMPEIQSSSEIFLNLFTSEWHCLQSVETYGRGGPAPGVGVGWGASGGGFWSTNVLLAQKDAAFLIYLIKIMDFTVDEGQSLVSQRIIAALGSCFAFGPSDKASVEKAFDFLLQVPVIGYLLTCIHEFAALNGSNKLVLGEYKKEDLLEASSLLSSHFKNRWLRIKKKAKVAGGSEASVGKAHGIETSLKTIHEDLELNENANDCDHDSLMVEWAHQRLHLPVHWFLSPISTIDFAKLGSEPKNSSVMDLVEEPDELCKVAKAGLLFILGLETMSRTRLADMSSPVLSVPLVWKFHSLSMILLIGMDVLEDEKSRVLYEALQDVFGQLLDQARSSGNSLEMGNKHDQGFSLRFQLEIHDSYPTFVETVVDQFGAVSYGDLIYGRQVALYLHRHVEASVRLATWNALSNARVFELLPPLEKSLAAPEGYLEPAEDNDDIMEAYVKSWTSGALDRAATRRSLAFTLFLHHTSSFLFLNRSTDKVLLRNKLVKSLLRDYSRKHQHEGFMLNLIRYSRQPSTSDMEQENVPLPISVDAEQRFHILRDACEGNISLIAEVEKLRSAFLRYFVLS